VSFRVPFVDPKEHYRRYRQEIDAAITETLAAGDLVQRRQLRDFESHLAEFVGVRFAVGVNSCYHALYFSLLAAGIGRGDEVVTVAHTFPATVSAIVHTGATPVLIDVRPDYNLDPGLLEPAITPRTKAILPVHLNGRVCEMDRIEAVARKYGLIIVEDAAQAIGAAYKDRKAGSFGLAGCFSFYPFKSLGGLGDGGAITTNDPQVARIATLMRFNGEDRETHEFHCHGYTALLDNVQAAVLDKKLKWLPEWIECRRNIAALYQESLQDLDDLSLPAVSSGLYCDSFQNYVIRTPFRDDLREHLTRDGIETLVHWPKPIWDHKGLGLKNPNLQETERICREVLSLPMSAETTPEQVEVVATSIRRFFAKRPVARSYAEMR
jgi:dTDP-4-amino-4,6-dideoxygalactose transaminase